MRTKTLCFLTLGLTLLAVPGSTLSPDASEEPVLITDPALLTSLGFPPDATNVYATPQAYEQWAMSPAERAALQETRLAELRAAQQNESAGGAYGSQDPGYSPLWASSFHAVRRYASTSYQIARPGGLACFDGGGFTLFEAQLESLPHGARLERLDVWYWDASDEDLQASVLRACNGFLAPGPATFTFLGTVESSGTGGHGIGTVSLGEDIDQTNCFYTVLVRLDDDIAATCSEGEDLRFVKARAQWRRQVAPPPATATFDDVPTDHLFFRHIEALADSGITGGCGGDSFCPNAPLTRAQMAAFLATALGLHWGPPSVPSIAAGVTDFPGAR